MACENSGIVVERAVASAESADAIARLINRAFQVEAWFVDGDRTSGPQVETLMRSPPTAFFLARDGQQLCGCVYTELIDQWRGYIGLLAVAPEYRRQQLGRRLLASADDYLRSLGCVSAEITVVDLRTDLFPYYEELGYWRTGVTVPFPRESKVPCALVIMVKAL